MVFGPLLDAMVANREGTSPMHVLSRGNLLVSTQLSLRVKVAFWLTNVPYYLLAVRVATTSSSETGLPGVPGSQHAHALAIAVVAIVSTAFHGSVLFLASSSRWPKRLLSADLIAANGYGAILAWLCGVERVLAAFALPLLLLLASATLKRTGRVLSYAAFHGAWHVLSAGAMARCLYDAERSQT